MCNVHDFAKFERQIPPKFRVHLSKQEDFFFVQIFEVKKGEKQFFVHLFDKKNFEQNEVASCNY